MDNYISFHDCENAEKYCILFAQVLVKSTKVKKLHKKSQFDQKNSTDLNLFFSAFEFPSNILEKWTKCVTVCLRSDVESCKENRKPVQCAVSQ